MNRIRIFDNFKLRGFQKKYILTDDIDFFDLQRIDLALRMVFHKDAFKNISNSHIFAEFDQRHIRQQVVLR